MAGTKGKVGGRKIKTIDKEHTCDKCGDTSAGKVRVRTHSTTGKKKFIWCCKDCVGK